MFLAQRIEAGQHSLLLKDNEIKKTSPEKMTFFDEPQVKITCTKRCARNFNTLAL
jgi:hypothetical protein